MLKFIKNLGKKKNNDDVNIIAKCPKCGKEVLEAGDYWACVDILSGNCNFRINNVYNGKKVDVSIFDEFQKIEEYEYIHNVVNNKITETKNIKEKKASKAKSGHRYAGNEFFEKGVRMHGSCPKCGERIYKLGNIARCMYTPDHCSFEIKASYKGVTFDDATMNRLFEGYVSDEYTFTDDKGKKFTGRVFIDIDKKTARRLPRYKFIKDIDSFIESIDDPEDYYLKFVYRDINGKFCRMNGELVHQF